jgi:enoyl-CoA hydratase
MLVLEFGGVEMLAKCVGKSYAMEMLLTGTRINAEEALKRGLISKVIPGDQLLNETITMVEKIVKNPVTNLVLAKKTINHAFDTRLRL